MCGLTGFWHLPTARIPNTETYELIRNMGSTLAHRGPDDAGIWVDDATGLALAHQRLSIIDLSPAGHQPMASTSGRWVLVFNGEIYNHLELRRELELADFISGWRGHSDTETLLVGFEAWGIETTLKKSVGMFALALWDREKQELTLARDRMGEKPLYYGWQDNVFLFGSELKALRAHPAFKNEIDRNALALFLRYNYVPSPFSIYRGIFKLPSGTYLQIGRNYQSTSNEPSKPQTYWSALEVALQGQANLFRGSDNEAHEILERILWQSVAGQRIADVPLGVFLSGGIDSSTVVALMQAQSNQPVRTFTIGFNVPGYDEADHAEAVARHLGCDHTVLYVSPEEAQAVIPHLTSIYDEPFADSSQIPTFLVAQLAKQQVTVALSGDGGDELFGGYNRHVWVPRLWSKLGGLPHPLRRLIASLILTFPPATWNKIFSYLCYMLPAQWHYAKAGNYLHKLAPVIALASPEAMYQYLISHWDDSAAIVLNATELPTAVTDSQAVTKLHNLADRMMALDSITYLPDDILVKVDRAAMAVSLETRVPLLDHRIVEFAWRLPLAMKIRNGESKWLLRQVLYRHVPRNLIERPKQGFSIPLDVWLRGPMRDWAETLLNESRLRHEGYFKSAIIRSKWAEHLTGKRNWSNHIWNVLVFQAWLESRSN